MSNIPVKRNEKFIHKERVGNYLALMNLRSYKGLILINNKGNYVLSNIDGKKNLQQIFDICNKRVKLEKRHFLDLINELEEKGIIYNKENDSDRLEINQKYQKITTYKFWISLTNQCNFRCKYCFVNKTSIKMNLSSLDSVLKRIYLLTKKRHINIIEFTLAGGEPLLEYRLIKKFKQLVTKYEKRYKIHTDIGIITNGSLLTKEMYKYFKKNNISVAISIDGIGKYQNLTRPFINQLGTFNYVIKNIALAKKYKVLRALSITVTSLNVSHIPTFVKYAIKKIDVPLAFVFFNDNKFANNISRANQKKLVNSFKKVLDLVFSTYRERGISFSPITGNYLNINYIINEFPYYPRKVICGAGFSYFTITPEGKIKFCPQQSEDLNISLFDENDVFKNVITKADLYYQKSDPELHPECKKCKWKYICAGGCRQERKFLNSEFKRKTSYCYTYKKLIPYHIKLEAKRILLNNLINQKK